MKALKLLAGIAVAAAGGAAVIVWASLAVAWVLRLLEIPSIFDRWLPGYSAFELLFGAIGLAIVLRLVAGVVELAPRISRRLSSRQ